MTVLLSVLFAGFIGYGIPIIAWRRSRKNGIRSKVKIRFGIGLLVLGMLNLIGNVSKRDPAGLDFAGAVGAFTGMLTPFAIADWLLLSATRKKMENAP